MFQRENNSTHKNEYFIVLEGVAKAQELTSELFAEVVKQPCEAKSNQEMSEILNRLKVLTKQM